MLDLRYCTWGVTNHHEQCFPFTHHACASGLDLVKSSRGRSLHALYTTYLSSLPVCPLLKSSPFPPPPLTPRGGLGLQRKPIVHGGFRMHAVPCMGSWAEGNSTMTRSSAMTPDVSGACRICVLPLPDFGKSAMGKLEVHQGKLLQAYIISIVSNFGCLFCYSCKLLVFL